MYRWLMAAMCGAVLCFAAMPGRLSAQDQEVDAAVKKFNDQTQALAEKIDQIIDARLAAAKVKPGAPASEGVFLRRLYIDLGGRIPHVTAVQDFLDKNYYPWWVAAAGSLPVADPFRDLIPSDFQAYPLKRQQEIDRLLAIPTGEKYSYADNFANYWRALMLTENPNNFQAQALRPSFEAWIKQRLQSNTGYDKMVHELLTANPNFNGGNGMNNVSPSAFYFGNENKVENLAGATSRIFLGVKIECAQCHPHPFAKWKQTQFWEYAAFFNGLQQFNGRQQQPVNAFVRDIKIPDTDKVVKAKFLDGTEPKWKDGVPTRQTLAEWVTSKENPYFAKAAVDHLWSYFFGISLLEPIMEPTDDSPPAHPELLDLMAREFTEQGFNLKFLVRAIVLTKAYQRESVSMSPKSKEEVQLFAKIPVRGMTPEQFFDSICEATYYREPVVGPQFNQPGFGPRTARQEFLSKFTTQDKRSETQTSILQALFLMNGKFVADRTTPEKDKNESLHTIATAPQPTADRVLSLYRLVLSREPRPDELARYVSYIDRGGATNDTRQAVADVYWALLNSSEFMLNH